MRKLIILYLALVPSLVLAQQQSTIYGGIDGGYGIVQLYNETQDAFDTYHAAQSSIFLGYNFNSDFSTEVSYLLAKTTSTTHDGSVNHIKINVVDVGLLYHSTTFFRGLFIKPSLGLMMRDVEEYQAHVLSRKKENSYLFSFGIGYEYQATEHLSLRVLHSTYLAWRGDRMNHLKLGIKLAY